MAKTAKTEQEEPLEKKLWKAADKLRKNMDAAEYKHVALGLIFLADLSIKCNKIVYKITDKNLQRGFPVQRFSWSVI
jgi:type I restriction enzyme M protein